MTERRSNYLFKDIKKMELELHRSKGTKTEKSCISKLFINGVYECFVLEDKDRGLDSKMNLDVINHLKVFGQTAIPTGRYEIVITKSERFSMLRKKETFLPLLLNTPGYGGVRVHTGNRPEDTEGCLITGSLASKDYVTGSTLAFTVLFGKIQKALENKEKVFITIN